MKNSYLSSTIKQFYYYKMLAEKAMEQLQFEDLSWQYNMESNIVYIRNEGHTVVEALNRQLAHYPYHVGQIVFIARMIAGTNWKSLSIARNQSQDYNADKFSQDKGVRHFYR